MRSIGIDVGSRTTKIVLFNFIDNCIEWHKVVATGISHNDTANNLINECFKANNICRNDVNKIYATGYGRKILNFIDKQISEISCHAKGVFFYFPKVKTILDIGGQDSKVISTGDKGKVVDFCMNDKCASGTGRFLEKAADILQIDLKSVGSVASEYKKNLEISSTCVVFAESEIIGMIAKGENYSDILNAVNISIAKRTKQLFSKIKIQDPIVFTGGVANNSSMKEAIVKVMGKNILISKNPSITGALGAALFANEN